jgi:selenocysteine lyase/cysteine desulfurase
MDFDVARARIDTPGCDGVIHFNNAGASLMPSVVHETVVDHLTLEYRIGGYEAADARADELTAVYEAVARLIGSHPDEVALIENATRAWDMAFYSLDFAPGDRILTSVSEYASNYIAFLQRARKTGTEIIPVPNDEYGALSIDALRGLIDERVKLIAVTHVPTNGGLVNPAAEIGILARERGIPYLLDACQSVGQIPIDVDAIGCDMLSATGRKYLRGPRGTGFLYVRRAMLERLEPPFLDLHAAEWTDSSSYRLAEDARRFETWERDVAATLGLGAAVRYALEWGVDAIEARVQFLAETLRSRLSSRSGVTVRDLGSRRCGIVSFTMDGITPDDIVDGLRRRNVNVSKAVSSHTLLDMTSRGLASMVRASVHYYNTLEEIDAFVQHLDALARD